MTSGAGAGLWKRAEIARARLPSKENLICSLLARADFVSYRSLIRLNAIQDWRKQPNARFKFRLAPVFGVPGGWCLSGQNRIFWGFPR
jgi:hypothetical protein